MLCISAKETQKGKDNSITHHTLVKNFMERSLRDASPMSWEKFVQAKTLQPQAALNEQPSEENVVPTDEPTEKRTQNVETENVKENVSLPIQETQKPTSS